MTRREMHEFKPELQDDIFELASRRAGGPGSDPPKVEAFFYKLEEDADGEKKRTTSRSR